MRTPTHDKCVDLHFDVDAVDDCMDDTFDFPSFQVRPCSAAATTPVRVYTTVHMDGLCSCESTGLSATEEQLRMQARLWGYVREEEETTVRLTLKNMNTRRKSEGRGKDSMPN